MLRAASAGAGKGLLAASTARDAFPSSLLVLNALHMERVLAGLSRSVLPWDKGRELQPSGLNTARTSSSDVLRASADTGQNMEAGILLRCLHRASLPLSVPASSAALKASAWSNGLVVSPAEASVLAGLGSDPSVWDKDLMALLEGFLAHAQMRSALGVGQALFHERSPLAAAAHEQLMARASQLVRLKAAAAALPPQQPSSLQLPQTPFSLELLGYLQRPAIATGSGAEEA